MNKKEITINWHIIQKCNYSCDYCFAKYTKQNKKEIHRFKEDSEIILKKLFHFFKQKYTNYNIRLNIAGGEPALSKNFCFLIKIAYQIGFKVSIITNSSKLTEEFIETNARYISMFATSIDSLDETTNINIGRTEKNIPLIMSNITKYIELLKYYNPNIKIKINTVVNKHNYNEYLGDFIDAIKPTKWKVLQALSLTEKIYCTNEQFDIYLNNHKHVKTKIYKETNEDMTDSYIMIDPYGRFYQNTNGTYNYSESILNVNIEDAFKTIEFDINKFNNRYIIP